MVCVQLRGRGTGDGGPGVEGELPSDLDTPVIWAGRDGSRLGAPTVAAATRRARIGPDPPGVWFLVHSYDAGTTVQPTPGSAV